MLKSELAQILSQKTGLPEAAVLEGLYEMINFISQTLNENSAIEIRGFGRFSTRHHIARRARNPKTGEQIRLADHKIPHFTPSKLLIKQLNYE